ncbi:hypothetical protein LUX12_21800 [Streptomyces somaliensis]|uniref:hypothetical protein n=1 Tax=Streptomyces somaliensis TaxID=78355 RepID=UPI0020CCEC2E|nr:hypothetical protein [Streptomyces somaliensis]MCP9946840.1 hypothetical protein [Streptomyces somaliensis]MCP9963476.1 hypothetical protein [Streptomyces somaliensis]MCP9976249.1 hypothetical protein [Streptomyces somaliensis]
MSNHPLIRRWPTFLALGLVLVTFVDGVPPMGFLAALLVVMPVCYLAFGAARGEFRDRRTLRIQLAGFAGFSALAAVALVGDARWAPYLVASGWFAHGVWDLVHNRSGSVVPRAWSEWCGVVDTAGALAILALV